MNIALIALYLLAVLAANLIVTSFGPVATPVVAFVFIGLNLATRDRLHDLWGKNVARNMLLLITVGGVLSYLLNMGARRIAFASVAAFALSELVDAFVYHLRRERRFLVRSNTSNIAGAAVDSLLFPVLAFGGFPVTIILLQFLAKVFGGFIWSLILASRQERAQSRA